MIIHREQLIKRLSQKTGYCQKDIYRLFKALDEVTLEYFNEVENDEDIVIHLLTGMKLSAHIVPQRERLDPTTKKPIIVGETVKPSVKFSQNFKNKIQEQYKNKLDG